jgi:hypothetical protein
MFIQVITGKVNDVEAFRRQDQRWHDELEAGATGFLGSTAGTTDDGRFVVSARFESADAAKRNSDRPEQGAWWAETEQYLSDVEFHDSNKQMTLFGGGSNDATFVQVMRGRITDRDKATALESRTAEFESVLGAARPDVIGETMAYHDDGDGYTDIVYFTSEAEARANEQKEMPAEAQKLMEELMSAVEVDEYLDLKDPSLR